MAANLERRRGGRCSEKETAASVAKLHPNLRAWAAGVGNHRPNIKGSTTKRCPIGLNIRIDNHLSEHHVINLVRQWLLRGQQQEYKHS